MGLKLEFDIHKRLKISCYRIYLVSFLKNRECFVVISGRTMMVSFDDILEIVFPTVGQTFQNQFLEVCCNASLNVDCFAANNWL